MKQLSMFHDPLDDVIDEWCKRIASYEDWENRINLLFDGFQGGLSQTFCYEVRNKVMMYSDDTFNCFEPEPNVRKITKEEFAERVKEYR